MSDRRATPPPTCAAAPRESGRLVICPDCAAIVAPARCTPTPGILPLGIFIECPECAVGSPIGQWKEGKLS